MEPPSCDHCGRTFDEQGIHHRRRVFCSDDCCEAFEDEFMVNGEPEPADLLAPVDELEALADEENLAVLDPEDDIDPLRDEF